MNIKLRDFESQILYFNGMYKLPITSFPSSSAVITDIKTKNLDIKSDRLAVRQRLTDFKKILSDELDEIDEIIEKIEATEKTYPLSGNVREIIPYAELDFLVDIADLLGDIQVYCASEMAKYGIPQKETLRIIMSSNFSKLSATGEPIYDENGKVQKGPGYWRPEPQIKQMLEERIFEGIGTGNSENKEE